MKPEDWEIIQAAFREATHREGAARDELLQDFAKQHPTLIEHLRALIDADSDSNSVIEVPIAEASRVLSNAGTDRWINRKIDVWLIKRRIAVGGMGAIFEAERADGQFEQTVALKLMGAQLLSPDLVARFRAERQILANLSHPWIAKLHDGGTTEDDLPYLVMEYIDGLPIDQFCETNGLDLEARLRLFQKVCVAVDYAHRNLTVHRDLKPSNILVDADGNPKLLDFGIAKLLEAPNTTHTMALTRAGVRAMTPEYASPEQVRGEPVSVATDTYSLGVLLYRLLTGVSPYGVETSSPLEYERAIIEQAPGKPSTRATGTTTGDASSLNMQQVRSRLAGDLDTIVLTALQKEPERRYPSVSELGADIGRHLRHEPIVARGDDWAYVTKKFLRRNARGVAVTAFVIAGIATLVTFYTLQLANERDRANLAAAESREVATFLTDMFASASPHVAQGEVVTATDLLEQGRDSIDALDEQPQLQAELLRIIGRSYTALGSTDESIAILERSLQLKRNANPPEPLAIAETLHNLSEAHRQHGGPEQAEALMRESLAIVVAELGEQHATAITTRARLGVILFDQRRTEDAYSELQRALEASLATGSPDALLEIDIRGNMANALDNMGRYDEALAMHDETIAQSRQIEGELAPNTVIRMSNRGLVLSRLGRYDDAIEQLEAAIIRGEQVWPDTADQMAFMIGARAANLKRVGRLEESLSEYQRAADITRRGTGTEHSLYVARLRGVASALLDLRRFDEAESLFREAINASVRLNGDENYQLPQLYLFLARVMNRSGRFAEAELPLQRAESMDDKMTARTRLIRQMETAISLSGQGRQAEATGLFESLLIEVQRTIGPDSPALVEFLVAASRHYRRTGDTERALKLSQEAYGIAGADERRHHTASVFAVAEHGLVLEALGRHAEAAPLTAEARDRISALYEPERATAAWEMIR